MEGSSARALSTSSGVDGLAVGSGQLDDVCAEGLGYLDEAVAERTDGEGKHTVPGERVLTTEASIAPVPELVIT